MSVNQFLKSTAVSESSIPVPKRIGTGTKKSKRCAQLPELQKYIETIIKASNEYDPEDTSQSDKDKFPKERKFGSYSVYKGRESNTKHEKNKNQLNWSGSKNNKKAKTSMPDAVSRDVRVCNMYAPEFEDPRNWKHGKTDSLGPSVEIEKFLKKFYPNPYHIESFKEFKESDSKDELRDGTLPDVVISKANIHDEVDIEKRDNDFQTANIEPCKRDDRCLSLTSDTSLETQSTPRYQNKIPDPTTDEGNSISGPALSKKPSKVKSINGKSTASSRASSAESMSETFSRESQPSLRKRKGIKPKCRSKPARNDALSDYDIGKLKLLSVSDSEQSLSVTCIEKPNMRDVEISQELCEEIYKTEDFNELKEIYDIMYKAAESFLQISSKNESLDYSKNLIESNMFSRKLNRDTKPELNNSELNKTSELITPSRTELELSNSNKTEDEIYKTIQDKLENTTTAFQIKFDKREPTAIEKSLIDVLLEEDKFEYRRNPEDRTPEQVHETVSNYEVALLEEVSRVVAPEDKSDFTNTNEKTDDILDFMYGCLKKLNDKEKSPPGDDKKSLPEEEKSVSCKRLRKESVTDINYENPTTSGSLTPTDFPWLHQDSTESLLTKTFPDIKDIKIKYSAALGEINRKASRGRSKKRPTFTVRGPSSNYQIPLSWMPAPVSPITVSPPYQHSAEEIIQIGTGTAIQTVESQNELGGFTEDPREARISTDEGRIPKPLCPLSVKKKKSKTNTGKTLKDALEAEEKLLSNEQNARVVEEKPSDTRESMTECQAEVRNDTTKIYSHLADFTQPTSNFVVCVNSFPRHLRNPMSIRPTLPVTVSDSLSNIKNWNLKQIVLTSKFPLKKRSLSFEERCRVLEHNYRIKQEVLLTMNKSAVAYTARPVSLKIITNFSKPVEDFSLKSSQCLVTMNVMPVQEFVLEEKGKPAFQMTQLVNAEDDKPVKDLIEAIEDTEEKVHLLEQSSAENLCSRNSEMCSISMSEALKNEFSENEVGKVNDRQKVQELLMRTYNLQQKLYRYLKKMTWDQSTFSCCPMMQQEGVPDFGMGSSTKIEFGVKSGSSLPVVHWHMNPPDTDVSTRANESVTVNVSMVDHSTSYEPVEEEKCEIVNEPKQGKFDKENEQFLQDTGGDEDDRSSNYSFKSSNDYSEQSEVKPKKDYKDLDYMDNKKLFQKIYSEIESFRQSFEAEKLEKQQQQQSEPIPKGQDDPMDRRLAPYDPKTPAKVLRTVFTGKKSSTELTIGLKDVPMTKVGNISVEKTKFSPNHTKISVAFTKETREASSKLSSYLFGNMRSSLSTSITEYSGLNDNVSKSSQSLNGDSDDDDDEDDYKSVASNLGNSDLEETEGKPEPKDQKPVETSTQKIFTKHKFDFYRKMTPDLNPINSKPKLLTSPVCKYKELEPLKQALTDMQIRMRDIKREAIFNSNDYYERALKLAKMSAGFCQSCGNRTVIPNDTFGYYRTLLPRRSAYHRRNRHFRPALSPNPRFYSLHPSNVEVGNHFCELGIKHSSYILNPRFHSNRTVLRNSLQDMPILFERM